jgi:hypothetical protein
MVRNGYPCLHQLVILRHMGQLPGIEYFNHHWLAEAEPGNSGGGSVWTQDDMTSDNDIYKVNQEDGTEQSLPEVNDLDIERTMAELSNMSNRSIYVARFHFAKRICWMEARDCSCGL